MQGAVAAGDKQGPEHGSLQLSGVMGGPLFCLFTQWNKLHHETNQKLTNAGYRMHMWVSKKK